MMKTITLALLTLLVGAPVALAHGTGRGVGRHFEQLDANDDGKLTLPEMKAGLKHRQALHEQKRAERMAKREGRTEHTAKHAEHRAARSADREAHAAERFAKLDTDSNGALTRREVAQGMSKRFVRRQGMKSGHAGHGRHGKAAPHAPRGKRGPRASD